MIIGLVSTSTKQPRKHNAKRRIYLRHVYQGNEWNNGITTIRELLSILPKGTKGVLTSDRTGKTMIVTRRTVNRC